MRREKILIGLREYAGLSESSLGAHEGMFSAVEAQMFR